MNEGLTLTASAAEDDALRQQLIAGLDAGLPGDIAAFDRVPLALALRDRRGRLVGGLAGYSLFGWLAVELLWVDPAARGVGHGGRLLAAAEAEALRRGCRRARLNTYSFQAPGFYERCGYTRTMTLDDTPRGHQSHTYVKALA